MAADVAAALFDVDTALVDTSLRDGAPVFVGDSAPARPRTGER
ncbi:hypothetical protein [Kitasatospora cineracea]